MPFSFFISKKPSEITIFGIFLAKKKSSLAYISLKIDIFRSVMFYYVIVMSYVDRYSWFYYQWKEETLSYTMVPNNYTLGVSISSSQTCYKKDSERRRLNHRPSRHGQTTDPVQLKLCLSHKRRIASNADVGFYCVNIIMTTSFSSPERIVWMIMSGIITVTRLMSSLGINPSSPKGGCTKPPNSFRPGAQNRTAKG